MTGCWVVVGGAGFVGSHIVHTLANCGHEVVAIDDLSTGRSERIPDGTTLVVADARDSGLVREVLADASPIGIAVASGPKQARESVVEAARYWENHVSVMCSLALAVDPAVTQCVALSSTCAVYGDLAARSTTQTVNPISPYGRAKWAAEQIMEDALAFKGIRTVALRYFNAIGNSEFRFARDEASQSLLPRSMRRVLKGLRPEVYGRPGNSSLAQRDYIDVRDIAGVYGLLAKRVDDGVLPHAPQNLVLDVASGRTLSTVEVIEQLMKFAEVDLEIDFSEPQHGDPHYVASRPSQELESWGWQVRYSLSDSIQGFVESVKRYPLS